MGTKQIRCPYCGERLDIFIDRSVSHQEYIEDCQVCCQPMTLSVTVSVNFDGDDQDVTVIARSSDD